MTLAEFYRATPRETVMVIQAAQWRREDEERRAMRAAWHTANLAGLRIFGKGRFPDLDRFVPKTKQQRMRRMTPEQANAHLEAFFAGFPRKKKANA